MQKYFWLIVLVSIALGFLWPAPALPLKPYLQHLLMLIMFFTCLKMDVNELKKIPQDAFKYAAVLILVFIIPSIIIFLFKDSLNREIFIGLLLSSAVPAGISVVFMSDILGGHPVKALVSTTLSHLISPILTPLIVWIFARQIIHIDFLTMAGIIAKLIFIPFVLAQIIRRFKVRDFLIQKSMIFNIILTAILIWGIIAPTQGLISGSWNQIAAAAGVVFLNLIIKIILSSFLASEKREAITWIIVSFYKNSTMASVIALSMFGPVVLLGTVVEMVVNNIMLIPIQLLSRKIR
ncbi:hypothetical protein HZC21_00220 [Candidatus Peregrinibacteria bacterium]|nr:hypothetical protein [Candidatus Peregrinibacteria bacterium]